MYVRISERGKLILGRLGKEHTKEQTCPFKPMSGSGTGSCGDWCPLFQVEKAANVGGKAVVHLCHETDIEADELVDQRPGSPQA